MTITVEATYENGSLILAQPLPLNEREKVHVTVHTPPTNIVEAYGIMGWTGDAETLERIALGADFLPEEEP